MEQDRFVRVHLKTVYFLIFFSFGGLFPLLSVYLRDVVGLSGAEIGTIMSIGPLMMIFAQPLWGILSDYTQKPREILSVTMIITGGLALFYLPFSVYIVLVIVAASVALFQGSIVPISDSITLNYVHEKGGDYGSIRLWGAAGFSISVLLVGTLSDIFGLQIIFYTFAVSLWLCAYFTRKMPKEGQLPKVQLKKGISQLIQNKQFILFMMTTFFVFGPIFANNFYFGLLIQDVGGSLTGVGIAFLLAAGSEIPFMRWVGYWIDRIGLLKIILIAAIVSSLRWFFYAIEPAPILIYITTIAQGMSIGLFIPAAIQYVRKITPEDVKVTAVSVYSSVGGGLGTSFCTLMAGFLLERFDIFAVYLFFGGLTTLGVITIIVVMRWCLPCK
ncbi:MFS transporter [Anaerobacillus isosaccharinicus]|uniref:MFS transporter n=1 Tax=Anaerobacillus isosaccharinicus TaxID=1532552 RepID=A0A1S2KV09_9BACI|nr:MFS transporter [Anaerobacillus isosaccharinicus]MBA5588054.1 MFS transporter [Anaerobacillus isosaccharinicus]QOY33806.1 MFS transporter [Anaerobacillus isosaccharinicus]